MPKAAGPTLPVTQGTFAELQLDIPGSLRRLYEEHGQTAAFDEGATRVIFAFGPQYSHQVLSDMERFHSRFAAIRGPRRSAQRRLTSGLLSMNGEQHRRHRRMLSEPFQRRSFAGFQQTIVNLAERMVGRWQIGSQIDIAAELTEYMLEVTSGMLFGVEHPQFAVQLGRTIDHWLGMNHRVGVGALGASDALHREYEPLLEQAEEVERQIREFLQLRRSGSELGSDVLSLLLKASDEQGGLTDDELVGHTALLFSAAHMTTAHTLTWTSLLLAQHPQTHQAVYEELVDVLGDRCPTLADFDQLPQLERTIKESMRVLPASAYSQRVAACDLELGPFQVRRGTPVVFSQYIAHRMPEYFDQPRSFQPDRWRTITPPPYAYMPFAMGPRLCLGGPLSLVTIKLTLSTILRHVTLQSVPGSEIDAQVISTMLSPTTPVPMQLLPPGGPFRAVPIAGNVHESVELPR